MDRFVTLVLVVLDPVAHTAVLVSAGHPVPLLHRRDGRLGTYSVWHDRLRPLRGVSRHAHFEVFTRLGLVERGAAPHSVLLQRETEFIIKLPPKLAAEHGEG